MSIKRNGCSLYEDGNCKMNGKRCNYIPKKCNQLNNSYKAIKEMNALRDDMIHGLTGE